jgi:hypothetical protein
VILGGPDGTFGRVGSVIVGGRDLELNVVVCEPLSELGGALVVNAVKLGLATTAGQGVVDLGDGFGEGLRSVVGDRAKQDIVAVVVIGNEEVLVASGRSKREPSSLIAEDDVAGLNGGEKTRVRSGGIGWLGREVFGVKGFCNDRFLLGTLNIFTAMIHVPHGSGFGVGWIALEGSQGEARNVRHQVALEGLPKSRDGRGKQGCMAKGNKISWGGVV